MGSANSHGRWDTNLTHARREEAPPCPPATCPSTASTLGLDPGCRPARGPSEQQHSPALSKRHAEQARGLRGQALPEGTALGKARDT